MPYIFVSFFRRKMKHLKTVLRVVACKTFLLGKPYKPRVRSTTAEIYRVLFHCTYLLTLCRA